VTATRRRKIQLKMRMRMRISQRAGTMTAATRRGKVKPTRPLLLTTLRRIRLQATTA
jgi:hypothetical protein